MECPSPVQLRPQMIATVRPMSSSIAYVFEVCGGSFSELTQISHEVGSKALAYLALLKQGKPDMGAIEATGNQLKTSIQALSKLVEVASVKRM